MQTIPAKGGKDTTTIVLPNGVLLASWGTDWPVNDSAKYAKETVGLGVFIPKEFAGECVHDKQNNMCLLDQSKPPRGNKCRGVVCLSSPLGFPIEIIRRRGTYEAFPGEHAGYPAYPSMTISSR